MTEMTAPEPKTFDKGLIFVKDTNILLSGDKWTIAVNVALDDYTALVQIMRATLNHIRQKIRVHKKPKSYSFDIHWDELNRLDTTWFRDLMLICRVFGSYCLKKH